MTVFSLTSSTSSTSSTSPLPPLPLFTDQKREDAALLNLIVEPSSPLLPLVLSSPSISFCAQSGQTKRLPGESPQLLLLHSYWATERHSLQGYSHPSHFFCCCFVWGTLKHSVLFTIAKRDNDSGCIFFFMEITLRLFHLACLSFHIVVCFSSPFLPQWHWIRPTVLLQLNVSPPLKEGNRKKRKRRGRKREDSVKCISVRLLAGYNVPLLLLFGRKNENDVFRISKHAQTRELGALLLRARWTTERLHFLTLTETNRHAEHPVPAKILDTFTLLTKNIQELTPSSEQEREQHTPYRNISKQHCERETTSSRSQRQKLGGWKFSDGAKQGRKFA